MPAANIPPPRTQMTMIEIVLILLVSTGIISGVVISAEDLQPLPGVNIVVQGTSIGTFTDTQGNFTMELENPEGQTIVASYIGMESEEVIATSVSPI